MPLGDDGGEDDVVIVEAVFSLGSLLPLLLLSRLAEPGLVPFRCAVLLLLLLRLAVVALGIRLGGGGVPGTPAAEVDWGFGPCQSSARA